MTEKNLCVGVSLNVCQNDVASLLKRPCVARQSAT